MDNLMKEILQIAQNEFIEVGRTINSSIHIDPQISSIRFKQIDDNSITANCVYNINNKYIKASIKYGYDSRWDEIYSDTSLEDVSNKILSAYQSPILAAGEEDVDEPDFSGNEPAFPLDDFGTFDDAELDDNSSDDILEDEMNTEVEEMENPEETTNIDTENNIENHFIVECNRCHGIFISALQESDQVIEFISGICPLCEKESDQYVKWVIKPVEEA